MSEVRAGTKTPNLFPGEMCSQWKPVQILLLVNCEVSDQPQFRAVQWQRVLSCAHYGKSLQLGDMTASHDLIGDFTPYTEKMSNVASLFTLHKLCDFGHICSFFTPV